MNERNVTSIIRAIKNAAIKRFVGMNKGSKLLLRIGSLVFLAFLVIALILTVLISENIISFSGQDLWVGWIVLYPFRFWVVTVFGALLLDILVNK